MKMEMRSVKKKSTEKSRNCGNKNLGMLTISTESVLH